MEARSTTDQQEIYSAYLYLSMAAASAGLGLAGFAKWFKIQFHEEMNHAMKFFDYVNEQGGRVTLKAIKDPDADFKSPTAMFEQTFKHEQSVTASIYEIVDLAIKERDHATHSFLKWFVDEQVEEEANAQAILTKYAWSETAQGL
jgi:ferritin